MSIRLEFEVLEVSALPPAGLRVVCRFLSWPVSPQEVGEMIFKMLSDHLEMFIVLDIEAHNEKVGPLSLSPPGSLCPPQCRPLLCSSAV